MSEAIKHECGIVLIRLLKPLDFYKQKYGTPFYGLNKLYLLMEKQHNRGQDGVGIANVKFDVSPGYRYISRERSNSSTPIKDVFDTVNKELEQVYRQNPDMINDSQWLKDNVRFSGEVFLGHLRYGTFGNNNIDACHPFIRENNWMSRNLVIAGNFNLTNVDDLFKTLISIGQHPKEYSDTTTILEKIGHFLDEENAILVKKYRSQGYSKQEISKLIAENIDLQSVLSNSCKKWDGGYVMSGFIGNGDSFILRDPAGIRPAFFYQDDEVVVAASERPAIQTAFNISSDKVQELEPAHALIIKKNGDISIQRFAADLPKKPCSFERIYFSRGTDVDIYRERKALGRHLAPVIRKEINDDFENTVFSFIPNTAETCYLGLMESLREHTQDIQKKMLCEMDHKPTPEELDRILSIRPRGEKVAVKDAKMRTFITQGSSRNELAAHVYDITYGVVRPGVDSLVMLDDSIVRGTTLRESIFKILDRTGPRRIIFVSSAPQIRYLDCYGIDMAKLEEFIAFQAAIALLKETGRQEVIDNVYKDAKAQLDGTTETIRNAVQDIYKPFTAEEISDKIAELLRPKDIKAEIKIIYQSIENLHRSCPDHKGDWYFTGNYPTPGGIRVVNRSFVNYYEGRSYARAY
jgi:amidophosphoribosyltransferase